ncbi:MAG TPA: YqaJ viral recombinase family protein [Caulobacteraceae bacterium]|jgi:putative phage-type endonuclease
MILQRTPQWYAQRLGKVTASRVSHVIAKTKTGVSALRANYAADLIAERVTGRPGENYVSGPMQWGIDHEDEARACYQDQFNVEVVEAEFVDHPEIAWSGASPDGYVEADGLIEIKCPNTATHIATLLGMPPATEHLAQMQWQMACSGRLWCDYASFDPRLPESMRLHVCRVLRNTSVILELEVEVSAFLDDIAERVARLTKLYGPTPAMEAEYA